MDIKVDRFADIEILRYEVTGFDELSLRQKTLLYYLTQAALAGRDIIFDQNCRWNLPIRKTLEAVYENYTGDRAGADWDALVIYLKRVWFSNGIHHHYAADKIPPGFSATFFTQAVRTLDPALLPLRAGQSVAELLDEIVPVIFDATVLPKKINQTPGDDLLRTSANNYYYDVSQAEAEAFYAAQKDPRDTHPISYGLNSRLVKENGKLREQVWRVGGMYSPALEKIVFWLRQAAGFAENERQRAVIEKLISYYHSGDLREFDAYAILWVEDTAQVDFVNGFTETYGDALGLKASWESVVNFKDMEASRRTEIISRHAQWFEDNSPVATRFKKEYVRGVSAKVITVAMLGGDCYPATPIGINLPNADWIRREHGSKSVTIENITRAYDQAARGSGFDEEFYWSATERELALRFGFITDNLHTDLHECLGHGSGQLLPGITPDALSSYHSTIEEARADLFALYYIADPKMVKLGLLPDGDAYKAEYYRYMLNGMLTQLVRIEFGRQIEEAHMRNRALVARWIYERGQADAVVELRQRYDKTYVLVNDYEKMRRLTGELLAEIQRIKSEGDYAAARHLVENYGVRVEPRLHREMLTRYRKLNIAPYKGFVNPVYNAVTDSAGNITAVSLDYGEDYTAQMLRYGKEHSWL